MRAWSTSVTLAVIVIGIALVLTFTSVMSAHRQIGRLEATVSRQSKILMAACRDTTMIDASECDATARALDLDIWSTAISEH